MKDQAKHTEAMLQVFRADLHVHTALSPCAADEMTPSAIVQKAMERGLDMIAVCDHNTAENVNGVQDAARTLGANLAVIPGMELTSAEEVHVVALFPSAGAAQEASAGIRVLLPPATAEYYAYFGRQPIFDGNDRKLGEETASLAYALPLSLEALVSLIHQYAGLAVAAHVDRRSFSVYSQLGLFPQEAGFDAIELSRPSDTGSPRYSELSALGLPMVASSDSHFLHTMGSVYTELQLAEPTFTELALALRQIGGRRVLRVTSIGS